MRAEQRPPDIDEETFRRFRAGEEKAGFAIVEALHYRVLAFLRVHTGEADLAEDIAQETFLRMFEHRERLASARQLPSWLFTVASRLAARERRRRNRPNPGENAPLPARPENPAGSLQREQRDRIVLRALAQLGENDRRLITLRYFGGLSIRQLSETLGIPMGSVGVKLSRVQRRLRRWLEERGHRPEDLL